MDRTLLAPPLTSTVDPSSEMFRRNRSDVLEQLATHDDLLAVALDGGGPKATDRHRSPRAASPSGSASPI